jgi:beta-N-acetylhexosaminidase
MDLVYTEHDKLRYDLVMKTNSPLFVSIEQPQLSDADRTMLRHPWVGGVVLFSKNFTTHAQIKSLVHEIKTLKTPALLVCVDHEGGRVQRFRKEFTLLPAMHRFGELYDSAPETALACAQACGYIIGYELGNVGIDFSFTPVLDLDYGASSVIGDRSFHAKASAVIALAGALIDGLAQTGMPAIGKHFPGHGYVVKDSHLELPEDPRSFADIAATDLLPFQALGKQLAGLMTAHVRYPAIDAHIATFSQYWLKQILREQLGYQGFIFSDDLMMKATGEVGDIAQRADAALNAGCDILLLCNDPDAIATLLANEPLHQQSSPLDYSSLYCKAQSDHSLYQKSIKMLTEQGFI